MTPEEHQAEHVRLHRALDELLACYLSDRMHLSARMLGRRRTSIHDEIFDLMKWSHEKILLPSPAPEDADAHLSEPKFLIAQNDDPELLEWLSNAYRDGGGFVKAIAQAGLMADNENYQFIRSLLMVLRNKYPGYEPSSAVKQEIRERRP